GVARAGIGQGNGKRDGVADVGRGIADRLGDGEVGFLWVDRAAVAVVGGVRIVLVGVVDARGVGARAGTGDGGGDGQLLRRADRHRANGPDAGRGAIAALAGRGRHEGNAGR